MKTLSLQEVDLIEMDIQAIKLDVMQKIMGVSTGSLLEKINSILDNDRFEPTGNVETTE